MRGSRSSQPALLAWTPRAVEADREYGIRLVSESALRPANAVILTVPHEPFRIEGWALIARLLKDGAGVVLDLRGVLDRRATPPGIDLWRL